MATMASLNENVDISKIKFILLTNCNITIITARSHLSTRSKLLWQQNYSVKHSMAKTG